MSQTNTLQLIAELGAEDWDTRHAASTALFNMGEAAIDALINGLSHSNWRVRAECAGLMDHLADARCAEPLAKALNDPSPHVRRHAVHSIGCQRCKIAPLQMDTVSLLVERAIEDKNIRVRRVAAHQLGLQPHDPRAVQALQSILLHDTDAKLLSRAAFALNNQRTSAMTA